MKKFEYLVLEEPASFTETQKDTLDKLGSEGWELVSVVLLPPEGDSETAALIGKFMAYYLKREVQG